jgi:hypothetical protein
MKKIQFLLILSCFLIWSPAPLLAADVNGIAIHGFLSQGFLKSSDNNYLAESEDGSFEFNEFGINFTSVFDRLRIGVQFFSRDLGDQGNNEITVDWAVADYRYQDYLGIRVGKVKAPIGLYNQTRDVDMLRTPIILPSSVYEEGMRDFSNAYHGACLYGIFEPPGIGEIEYEVFGGSFDVDSESVFIEEAFEKSADRFSLALGQPLSAEDRSFDSGHSFGGAVRWNTFIEGLRLGFSYLTFDGEMTAGLKYGMGNLFANYKSELNMDFGAVYSLEYMIGNFTFAAEYQVFEVDSETTIQPSVPQMPAITSSMTTKRGGWYCQASYLFYDRLTLGICYSEFYPDLDDKDGDALVSAGQPDYYAWQKEIIPSVRFDISKNWLIKAEVHFINGVANTYSLDNPEGTDENWNLYAVKVSFNF